jgi:hypothetical protein
MDDAARLGAAVMSPLPNTSPGRGFVPPSEKCRPAGTDAAETSSLDLVASCPGQDKLTQAIETGQSGKHPTRFLPGTSSGRSTIVRGPTPPRGTNPTARGSIPTRGGQITVAPSRGFRLPRFKRNCDKGLNPGQIGAWLGPA